MGYSPWGRKESDTTERLHSLTHSKLDKSLDGAWGKYTGDQSGSRV